MEYTKIHLKGYKRLQLSNINELTMSPKQSIQLILGMNGSGKSSLLREITPLPSPHSQYEAGGHKILELTHRNHTYQVINRFDGKSGRYQLLKDGTDIFEGSTLTDFRSLIKQEFGITPEIQTLIDGVTKFSLMDVSKRRQWFTLLSKVDYTYAIQYYGLIRSRIRDLQGSLTVTQNRMASELAKVLSEEEIKKTREKLKYYQDLLSQLLEMKPRMTSLRRDIETEVRDQDRLLQQTCDNFLQVQKAFIRKLRVVSPHDPIDEDTCLQAIYRLETLVEQDGKRKDQLHAKLQELSAITGQVQNAGAFSEQELLSKQVSLLDQLERNKLSLERMKDFHGDVSVFKAALESVYSNLTTIFEALPQDGTGHLTRASRENAIAHNRTVQSRLNELQLQITRAKTQIEEMDYARQHHQRECPSCHHQWYHGYNELKYQDLKQFLETSRIDEEHLIDQVRESQEELEEISRVFTLRQNYANVVNSWPVLRPLWDLLSLHGTQTPRQSQNVLESVLRDIPTLFKIESTYRELKENAEALEVAKLQAGLDIQAHKDLVERTEHELSDIQDSLRERQFQITNYMRMREYFAVFHQVIEDLTRVLDGREKNVEQLLISVRAEHFNRLINIFRQEVSVLEQSISRIDMQQNLIQQYQLQMQEHQDQIRLLKMAEQAMSPATGLIAKGLLGFINFFISRMNAFVKHIWVYPLEILPVSVTDDLELDYKFPVRFDERFNSLDIRHGECNNSTCEIFDLAFRVVAMECLGFRDFPLQLDEFGASFDHAHRNAGFQVVTSLTTSTDIPQIFVVSHHEQSYNGLRNADVTVLTPENVILPPGVAVNGCTTIS